MDARCTICSVIFQITLYYVVAPHLLKLLIREILVGRPSALVSLLRLTLSNMENVVSALLGNGLNGKVV